MADLYAIGYDLGGPERDYEELIDAIKDYGVYAKVVESMWIVQTTDSCSDIRNNLQQHMDDNDHIIVLGLDGTYSTYNSQNTLDWLGDVF